MQRLFSMFPQGGPGIALILLRGSILASLVAISARHGSLASYPLVLAGVVLVSLCVAIGFVTPVISVVAAAAAVAELLVGSHGHGTGAVSCVLLLDAAALGLLGPGAYSVDARLFGRRVTVLPIRPDSPGDD